MSHMVEIRGITKTFGKVTALADVNLAIDEGQFFALVGPSGSGKTTLLHILGGFVEPTSGQVLIAGETVTHLPPAKRPTTSMFQDYALFPHMSVETNVAFGLVMRKVARNERSARVRAILDMVGMPDMSDRRIHQLSGGQQQRVALARALVVEPKVLLLDEPLGALDLNLRRQMQQELIHIQKQVGTTFVHVTHDQEEAMSIADVIAVMNQGRIEDIGPPAQVYLKPRTLFTATFMGESNMFEGRVTGRSGSQVEVETALGRLVVPGEAEKGRVVYLSIRPEQIAVGEAKPERHLPLGKFRVQEISFFGTHHRCVGRHVDTDLPMTVRLQQNRLAQFGDELTISVARDNIVLLTH